MCVTHSRSFMGGGVDGDRAASFAGAAAISTLVMSDWQISQDVESAMVSAVAALDGPAERLEVTLHHDWIDVTAAIGGLSSRRRCFPRRPFRTPIDCHATLHPAVSSA